MALLEAGLSKEDKCPRFGMPSSGIDRILIREHRRPDGSDGPAVFNGRPRSPGCRTKVTEAILESIGLQQAQTRHYLPTERELG